ncbi:MAG TPA: hypothetical protein VMO00_05845 [Methylomirabilota bacterium]|nr:hypothetical protein [Methylomirabilota bacterium]
MPWRTVLKVWQSAIVIFGLFAGQERVVAQTLNELIAGAKKESEIAFTAGPTTFGGRQAFTEIQTTFNKSSD